MHICFKLFKYIYKGIVKLNKSLADSGYIGVGGVGACTLSDIVAAGVHFMGS